MESLDLNSSNSSKIEYCGRGKLKIFFGYAAGVGKTYAMLEAAHTLKKNGVDVVIGYIEPHTRPDTMVLVEGLETIPVKNIDYKGINLREFDLDRALERHPHTILVDEFAHTNAKGSRHLKRWQDIEELLLAGINVYTTLNVQHLESLNDIMEVITNVSIKETVPDNIISDSQTQIELIDIEPEELIERFNEGKIYSKSQAERAKENFFVKDNLVALREISLRKTADRVNKEVEMSRLAKSETDIKPTSNIILACISPSSSSAKIIRTAYRMADSTISKWIVLYVRPNDISFMSDKSKRTLGENFALAKKLGAEVIILHGENPAEQILRYSRVRNATKIIIGRKHNKEKSILKRIFKKDIADILLEESDIDVHIIPYRRNDNHAFYKESIKRKGIIERNLRVSKKDISRFLIITIFITIIAYGLQGLGFIKDNILLVYMLGVSMVSRLTRGYLLGILSSFLNIFILNYFFTAPLYTLAISDSSYIVTLAVFCIIGIITSTLTSNMQWQADNASKREEHTQMIYQITRSFLMISRKEDIIENALDILSRSLKRDVMYLPNDNYKERYFRTYNEKNDRQHDLKNINETTVAKWVVQNRMQAGNSTDTLSGARGFYSPVKGIKDTFGAVGVSCKSKKMDADDMIFIETVLAQMSIALDREQLSESREKDRLEIENERLRSNLLRAISHDIRTPLAGISGTADTIIKSWDKIDRKSIEEMLEGIQEDSKWLIRLVENLLSMTKIDEGKLDVEKEYELVEEVISESIEHMKRRLGNAKVEVKTPDEILFVPMDAKLIEQVMVNFMDNALKYCGNDCIIKITVYKDDDKVWFRFADNGKGLSDDMKKHIFDRFYTGEKTKDSRKGVGLGLSICKSIVCAHGGEIYANNSNETGGAEFSFYLPE